MTPAQIAAVQCSSGCLLSLTEQLLSVRLIKLFWMAWLLSKAELIVRHFMSNKELGTLSADMLFETIPWIILQNRAWTVSPFLKAVWSVLYLGTILIIFAKASFGSAQLKYQEKDFSRNSSWVGDILGGVHLMYPWYLKVSNWELSQKINRKGMIFSSQIRHWRGTGDCALKEALLLMGYNSDWWVAQMSLANFSVNLIHVLHWLDLPLTPVPTHAIPNWQCLSVCTIQPFFRRALHSLLALSHWHHVTLHVPNAPWVLFH